MRFILLLSLFAVSGCVAVPLGAGYPQPLAAYPGQGKSSAEFAQDDVACRASAAAQPTPPPPQAGSIDVQTTPASVYFDCMTARKNVVSAAPAANTGYALYPLPSYGYAYAAYPYGFAPYGGAFAEEYYLNRGVGIYGYGYGYGRFGRGYHRW